MKTHTMSYGLLVLALGLGTTPLTAQLPTIPPSITRLTPPGARRGSTIALAIEGRSLAGAQAVLFDVPGLAAKIEGIRDLPEEAKPVRPGVDTAAVLVQGVKQEAKVTLTVAPDVEPGLHRFRLQTPLGTSNLAVLEVGTLPEVQEREPNDSSADSQLVELPATLVGTVGWPGDSDSFQFNGRAGQEVVFQTIAASLGSQLQSVLVLRDSSGKQLARAGYFSRQSEAVLGFKLPADGKYTISISDLERRGGSGFFYRLNAGALPYITEVFPLGLRAGQTAEVEVKGFNLDEIHKLRVQAPAAVDGWKTIPLEVRTSQGDSLNKRRLAVGGAPEILENEPNSSPAQAQPITVPVTINGHIWSGKEQGAADEDYFRFAAKKDEHLIVEVAAERLGSPLDSVVEILDAQGREIPQVTVRSLAETSLTLVDRDSKTPTFRVTSVSGLRTNDYLMLGDEIVQLTFVPDLPDDNLVVQSYQDERISLFNTSPQVHAVNSPVYKVRIAEPGKEFPPNGLPLLRLTVRNDDGGPGYGADSRLDFTAPRDGEYLLHIKDVRGLQGEDFAYRLTVHEVRPDFELAAQPPNPNLPRGGRVPILVTANRALGYEGPIEVEVKGLPKGVSASRAIIGARQYSTVVVLTAPSDLASQEPAAGQFRIVGRAKIDGRDVVRVAGADEPLQVVSLMPSPDLVVTAEPKEIVLEPGKETPVTLHCERKNGFKGRILYALMNLPPGVVIVSLGLNGGVVAEKETDGAITLRAEDWVQPVEQPLYMVGTVESSSSTQHASAPLVLKVRPKQTLASAGRQPAASNR